LILPWLQSIGFDFDKSRNLLEDLLYDPAVYVINAYSPKLAPPASDATPNMMTIGFFWTDNLPDKFKPSEQLEKYLEKGEPPVYIGFGSMRCDNPEAFTDFTIEALRELKVRAILCEGWGSLRKPANWDENAPENENILFVSDIPHSYLFPRCKAAIVHGGAGTTSYALRAGLPVQIVPFLSDQPFWAGRIQAAGVGLAPIPASKLSKAHLLDRIPKLLNDPALHENANNLAKDLAAERPFETVLEILDRHLKHSGAEPSVLASESKWQNEAYNPPLVSAKIPA
jgi:sterol 3beta-glucosyltransferase